MVNSAKNLMLSLPLGLSLVGIGCAREMTTVRTINPEEIAGKSWIGRNANDVTEVWGDNQSTEPDGNGGRVFTYRNVDAWTFGEPFDADSALKGRYDNTSPNTVGGETRTATRELAKFWIGSNGKVYRYWFADAVYRKKLNRPDARPEAIYNLSAH